MRENGRLYKTIWEDVVNKKFKFLISTATLLCGATAITAAADDDVFRVGLLVPMSGPFSPIGEDMERGARLLFEQHPAVSGMPVELIAEDTEGKPATALRKAELLIDNGADAIVGVFSSAELLALSGVADQLGVPIIATNAATPKVTGEFCNRFMFRVSPNDNQMVRGVAEWLRKDSQAREGKWYILAHDYEWGRSSAGAFKKLADEIDIEVIGEDFPPMDTKDWSTYINKITASGADYVWAPVVATTVTDFIKQARSFGLLDKTKVFVGAGIMDSQLAAIGADAEGLLTASWASWTIEGDAMKEFTAEYWNAYKAVPGYQSIVTYNGAAILLDAFSRAKSSEADDLIAALETSAYDTQYGRVTMRKFDHQASLPVFIGEVRPAPANEIGSEWAVSILQVVDPAATDVPVEQTGCPGL